MGRYTTIVPAPSEQDQLERHFDPVPLPSVIYRQTRHVRTTAEPQPNYSQKRMKSAEPQPSNSPAAKHFNRLLQPRFTSDIARKSPAAKNLYRLISLAPYLRFRPKRPSCEHLLLSPKNAFSQTYVEQAPERKTLSDLSHMHHISDLGQRNPPANASSQMYFERAPRRKTFTDLAQTRPISDIALNSPKAKNSY